METRGAERMRPLWLGGVLIVVLMLTGCVKLELDVALQPDDTVDGSVLVALSKRLPDYDPERSLEELGIETRTDLPTSMHAESYEDEDWFGGTLEFDGADFAEFNEEIEEVLRLTRTGDEFEVTGRIELDLTDEQSVPAEDLELADLAEARIDVTFPGRVIDHNGQLNGRTVSWQARAGDMVELHAVGRATSGVSGPTTVLAAGAAALAAGVLLIVMLPRTVRKR